MIPRKPGQVPAPKSDAEKKISEAELGRYHRELLAAQPHELDSADQAALLKLINEGIRAGALRGEI